MVPPPPREELPPELRILPPPEAGIEERILEPLLLRTLEELLLERIVFELLLERFTEGLLERVAVDTLDARLVVVVVREGVATELLERVVVDTELLREGKVLRVATVLRVADERVAVVSTRLAPRTLLLPKVREASAVPRFDTRVAAPRLSIPTREALAVRIVA